MLQQKPKFKDSALMILNLRNWILFFFLFIPHVTYAVVQKVIVSASKSILDSEKANNQSVLIESDEIEQWGDSGIFDLLRTKAGMIGLKTVGEFGPTNLFLRGHSASHILIIVDGMAVNDPSAPGRETDVSDFLLSNIAKIEVLKSSQGVLYGSDAMGGAIIITTKKNVGRDSFDIILNQNGQGDSKFAFGLNKKVCAFKFNLNSVYIAQDVSDFSKSDLKNKKARFAANLKYEVTPLIDITFKTNYLLRNEKLDYFKSEDDLKRSSKFSGRLALAIMSDDAMMSTSFFIDIIESENKYFSFTGNALSKTAEFSATARKIGYLTNVLLSKTWELTLGGEHYGEDGSKGRFLNSLNQYFLLKINFSQLSLASGLRYSFHQSFRNSIDYELSMSYKMAKSLIFFTSLKTGYKTPTLFQIYDETYGNSNLDPEKSRSSDVGIHADFSDKFAVDVSLFHSQIDNVITYDFVANQNKNKGYNSLYGIEAKLGLQISEKYSYQLNAFYLKSVDENGEELLRRPRWTINNTLNFSIFHKLRFSLFHNYVGVRPDLDPLTFTRVTSAAFNRLGFNVTREFKQGKMWIKGENILNTKIQEIKGVDTAGFLIAVGVKIEI